MARVIDESDPCAAAAALRAAYYQIVAGQQAMTVSFRAGATGVERQVVFHRADPARLLTIIRGFEERCAAASGGRPRRYAIRAGGL